MASPSRTRRVDFVRRIANLAFSCICVVVLTSCASGGIVDKSLDLVGLMKKPDAPTMPTELPAGTSGDLPTLNGQMPGTASQRQIALRIHAGQVLNIDPSGRSLALVLRIYKLRGTAQFAQITYPMFAATSADKPLQGDDVISSKEIVLVPGQKYEMIEPMPREATHLAVVALFRSPDNQRWRFVFDARAATKTGITLGAHGCALSVAVGEPVGAQPDALRLAGVQCS
jgi:type VI secretion system protein VasD